MISPLSSFRHRVDSDLKAIREGRRGCESSFLEGRKEKKFPRRTAEEGRAALSGARVTASS